jgi:SAM-dependent methyltransferase
VFESNSYAYFEDVNAGLLRLWGRRSGLRVLDVGCGFATTSQEIQRRGNEVTGIESSPEAVAVAKQRLARVIDSDLSNLAAIGDATFDAIIFADVLEHLPWPLGVLKDYLRFLAPDGSVIISLPNVGLWSVRLGLLAGRFNYADTGVLDRTHLRFFTRTSARQLIDRAALAIEHTTYNPGLVRPFVPLAKKFVARGGGEQPHDPAALLKSPAHRLYMRTVHPLERAVASIAPGLLAFQMIFEAKRKR